jgi:hypothetical protein
LCSEGSTEQNLKYKKNPEASKENDDPRPPRVPVGRGYISLASQWSFLYGLRKRSLFRVHRILLIPVFRLVIFADRD